VRLAIIIPLLNRAKGIEDSLRALAPLRRHGHRVIVVDAGSSDDGVLRACALADRVIWSARGWSAQMNAGSRTPEAELADALVFLPDGVRLPEDADRAILRALSNSTSPWGGFDVRLRHPVAGTPWPLRLATALSNGCARATGICTREQAIFVTRSAFLALDGFAPGVAAADAEFCRRARGLGAPIVLAAPALVWAREARPLPLLRLLLRREWARLASALGSAALEREAYPPLGV
jgi:GT2 family glycosyltransferase